MKIGIIGSGHVGLVTGACFAHLGHQVICMDSDPHKIAMLKKGVSPIYEPGLTEMVRANMKERRLSFTADLKKMVKVAEVLFVCVGTPPKESGEANLVAVEHVAAEIAQAMTSYRIIVDKSTVPVQTGEWVQKTIANNRRKDVPFDVASNPEFLREGSAVQDFLEPDRVVLGVESKKAAKILTELYKPLNAPILITDIKSAELIKHASNSFLAAKISFINLISQVCEAVGADVKKVAEGMGLDKRIRPNFLNAGVGFGGFCFPKDLSAFIRISERLGVDPGILREVLRINDTQKKLFVQKVESELWNLTGKTVGVLGLSFKADTDDMRFAPSIEIINELLKEGVKIQAYDPEAIANAKEIFGNRISYAKNPYEAAKGTDALLILTEWSEFQELDFKRIKKSMRHPVIFDGRNLYEREKMKRLGFRYFGVGR